MPCPPLFRFGHVLNPLCLFVFFTFLLLDFIILIFTLAIKGFSRFIFSKNKCREVWPKIRSVLIFFLNLPKSFKKKIIMLNFKIKNKKFASECGLIYPLKLDGSPFIIH